MIAQLHTDAKQQADDDILTTMCACRNSEISEKLDRWRDKRGLGHPVNRHRLSTSRTWFF